MKRSLSVIFLFSLFCLTGCSLNFVEFSAPDGSYKVKLPGKPTKTPGAGDVWEIVTGNWNFGVGSSALPGLTSTLDASQHSTILNAGVNGISSSLKGSVKSQNTITLSGFPGIEAEMSLPAGPNPTTGKQEPASTIIVRLYIVNSKFFMLMARCRNAITRETPEVKTFFESFVLNVSPAAGSGTSGMPGMMSHNATMGHGATPGASSTGTPMANGAPSGTYSSSGTYTSGGGAAGTTPMPMGTPPMPNSTNMPPSSATAGMSPTNSGTPGTYNSGGSSPMPSATYNGAPMGATGQNATSGTSSNPADVNSANMTPGAPGQMGNKPTFTGTQITADMKLAAGDMVQTSINGQWIDAKVQRVAPNGLVQVRTQGKQFAILIVPKDFLQVAPGASIPGANAPPAAVAADTPHTDDASLPNAVGGVAKTRQANVAKPAATASSPKPEPAKGTGSVSLDGASIEELLKIIANKNEHRRILAAEKLAGHSEAGPNPEIAKKLIDLLKVDELTVRAAVAKTLEKWAAPEVHDAVLKNLTGGTSEVRQSMMRILAASKVEGSAGQIAQCLADKDDRKTAVEALITFGEPAQADVIRMLSNQDSKVKLAACEILKEIGTAEGLAALKKATESWSGTDRIAARKALQALETRNK